MSWRLPHGCALALGFQLVAGPLYDVPCGPWTLRPGFVLATVAAASLLGARGGSWQRAAAFGLILDALSLDPWGAQAAAAAVTAWIAGAARRGGVRPGIAGAACLLLAALGGELARGYVLWLWHEERAWPPLAPALAGALLTGLAAVVILPFLQLGRQPVALQSA